MSDHDRLKEIIDEIDTLIEHRVTKRAPAFIAWYTKAERFLTKKYGVGSLELSAFQDTNFSAVILSDISYDVKACANGLTATKLTFLDYLRELDDETGDNKSEMLQTFEKVFVVHGHDSALKESVARIVEKQDIEAIILSEQANQGNTIIEKFEQHSDVGGAICLFTADDLAKAQSGDTMQPRARQNVVFEAGYFMGKLGRRHVVILADSGIEMPSDLSGVVYTNTANWQFELLKELNAMGYTVDLNKLL